MVSFLGLELRDQCTVWPTVFVRPATEYDPDELETDVPDVEGSRSLFRFPVDSKINDKNARWNLGTYPEVKKNGYSRRRV